MDYLVAVLLPQLLHGLVFGAALGLLALGLTVIFGLLGVFSRAELRRLKNSATRSPPAIKALTASINSLPL